MLVPRKITFKKRLFKFNQNKHPHHFEIVKFIYYVYENNVINKSFLILEKKYNKYQNAYYHLYAHEDYIERNKDGAAFHTQDINIAKIVMVQYMNNLLTHEMDEKYVEINKFFEDYEY